MTTQDRSHETIINDTLARFLRERCRLDAVAETLRTASAQTSSFGEPRGR